MDIGLCAAILRVAVIGVLLDVVLSVPHRTFAADQQQRGQRRHTAYLVRRHQLFATESSDEFENGQKNIPPRLRGGIC